MNGRDFKEKIAALFTDCADFAVRESETGNGERFYVIYIINLCEKQYVTEGILKSVSISDSILDKSTVPRILAALPLSPCDDVNSATEKLLSGNAVICGGENELFAFAVDSKNESGRGISEPDSEVVIRGPRQGFVESAEANVTMIRKIIKSTSLKVVNMKFGDYTGTSVKIMYYEGIARQDIIERLMKRLSDIKLNSCLDSGYIERCLQGRSLGLFSEVGNSEKPDKVAAKILGGRIAIICDGSPVVLTVPYLFVESIQSSEDYLKNVYYASFVRMLRFLGALITLYLPAVYVAVTEFHKGALPYPMHMAQLRSRSSIPFDIFTELLIVLIIFELIREVGIRMPKAVGDAVGIVGGLILGDAAIKAGLASETVIMIAALTAICNFMNPTYMNIAVLIRFANLLLAKAFGFLGIAAGYMMIITILCSVKSFGVPFMSPFAPTRDNLFHDTLIMNPDKALSFERDELSKNGRR